MADIVTATPASLATSSRSNSPVAQPDGSNALGGDGSRFLGKIAAFLYAPSVRLLKCSQRAWHKRSLAQAYYEARLALGQSMYHAGIDDGQLGARIRDLDQQILRAETIQAPSKAIKLRRQKLILQLADAALADEGPLPGADREYQQARRVEVALARVNCRD
jgi:hypothetical protein